MEKDEDILSEARDRYKAATEGWAHIYNAAAEDLRFVYDVDGGQWPDKIRNDREKDGRPVITVNKLLKFVRQLRGDQMLNRPRIKVLPVDDKADIRMADLYNGIIRQIEYQSSASIAYDTAYMHSVACSVGYFRLITKYADDMGFDQDIFIKRIVNPMAVHFDPSAIEFTLEDANFCFIEENMPKKEFQRLYPDAEMVDFKGERGAIFPEWIFEEKIRIAEYFWKEPVKKKIVLLNTGETVELNKNITIDFIKANGGEIIKERTVDTHKVMWGKINGHEFLEEKKEWPGKFIPVVPVFGDEIVAEGKKYYLSLTRGAKGPQEMYNYWATAATENVALTPKSPFIIDHKQIKGFEKEWEEANTTNRMYIRYNAIAGLQKPARERQTEIPSAIMAMLQQTAFDIEDHLGRYESSKGQASNERSGKAIMARVAQSDKGTFAFVDNFTRAIVYAGRQIIDLIPKIYDTHRAIRIFGDDGGAQLAEVNKPIMSPTGDVVIENDLSVGKYDLIATVGASYSSKRQEMVDMMIQSMQYAPQLASVIAPLIFKYSDWPGSEEIYEEIKKQIEQMTQQQGNAAKTPQPGNMSG